MGKKGRKYKPPRNDPYDAQRFSRNSVFKKRKDREDDPTMDAETKRAKRIMAMIEAGKKLAAQGKGTIKKKDAHSGNEMDDGPGRKASRKRSASSVTDESMSDRQAMKRQKANTNDVSSNATTTNAGVGTDDAERMRRRDGESYREFSARVNKAKFEALKQTERKYSKKIVKRKARRAMKRAQRHARGNDEEVDGAVYVDEFGQERTIRTFDSLQDHVEFGEVADAPPPLHFPKKGHHKRDLKLPDDYVSEATGADTFASKSREQVRAEITNSNKARKPVGGLSLSMEAYVEQVRDAYRTHQRKAREAQEEGTRLVTL